MNIERLKRTSSLFSVASLIIAVLLLVAVVAVVVAGLTVAFSDSLMNRLQEEIAPETFVRNDIYLLVAAACMCIPLIALMFFLAHKLFGNVNASGTPFSDDNVRILKLVSYLMIILAVVSIAAEGMVVFNSSWASDAVQLGGGGFILIVMAVLFYFMAHVFEYGAALQKESDETL